MKNIHLIPTDKPSRLYLVKSNNKLDITSNNPEYTENFGSGTQNQHICITSDEEVKEGDYWYDYLLETVNKGNLVGIQRSKKIILTTDVDLIKDGVQAIDDEFLEWFVNNPSCEDVEVIYGLYNPSGRKVNFEILNQNHSQCVWKYKVIIPKEEPKRETLEEAVNKFKKTDVYINEIKQETLEEAIKREYEARKFNSVFPFDPQSFALGSEWQAEQDNNKFSEEEVLQLIINCKERFGGSDLDDYVEDSTVIKWFEQFKKK